MAVDEKSQDHNASWQEHYHLYRISYQIYIHSSDIQPQPPKSEVIPWEQLVNYYWQDLSGWTVPTTGIAIPRAVLLQGLVKI